MNIDSLIDQEAGNPGQIWRQDLRPSQLAFPTVRWRLIHFHLQPQSYLYMARTACPSAPS